MKKLKISEPYAPTSDERLAIVDVIDALEMVSTANQFTACMDNAMTRIFPHGGLACGIGSIAEENARPYRMLLHKFPRAYIDSIRQPDGGLNSPLMTRWRTTREPVLADLENSVLGWAMSWVMNIRRFDMRNLAAHGLVDVEGNLTSYFCFIRIPERLGEKHVYLLNRLVPHLHTALVRAMATMEDMNKEDHLPPVRLTRRQKEVLKLLQLGKTNREIADQLGASEETIKCHVSQIFGRLNAINRTHAVAKALSLKIIGT